MFGEELDLFKEIKEGIDKNKRLRDIRPAHINPSSASVKVNVPSLGGDVVIGGCNRKTYLNMRQEPASDSGYITEDIGAAEIGNLLQDYIEGLFAHAGLIVQSELTVFIKEWNVSGRVDTILRKGDQYFGVEIKSKSGYYSSSKYVRPPKSIIPTDFRPDDSHLLQTIIYLYAFNMIPELKAYNIKKWYLLYTLREDGKYNYFEIELTDHDNPNGYGYPIIYSHLKPEGFIYKRLNIKGVIKRWEELNFCLKYSVLPNKDFELAYSIKTLTKLLQLNSPILNKKNKEYVANGKFSSVISDKGGINEHPLGDFQCYVCPFKSKCWGLNGLSEGDFNCTKSNGTPKPIQYSQFNPYLSNYFDTLNEDDKTDVRKYKIHIEKKNA